MSTGTMKLNNSTEVIPIQGSSEKLIDQYKIRNRPSPGSSVHNPTSSKPRHDRKRMPYFSDHMILSRVKQYLAEHSKDTRIDFEEMVDTLQYKYKEYVKRKRSAFKGLVDKAYYVVTQECKRKEREEGGNLSSESSGDEEFDSDEMMEEDSLVENGNKVNMQLMSMYANTQLRKPTNPAEMSQELINISSSEDEGAGIKPGKVTETDAPAPLVTSTPVSMPPTPATVLTYYNVANGRKHLPPLLGTPHYSSRPATGVIPTAERVRKRKATEMTSGSATPNIQKKKRELPNEAPRITFKDFGGNSKVLEEVCKLLVHIRHPEVYRKVGVSPPRGFLLHGPPGCGKTLLAQAIAGELGVPLIKVAAPSLVAGVSGQSEERIRAMFDQAVASAPCILFLDEVDAITPNRQTAQKEMERRIVAQLLTCLDDLGQKENGDSVLVIGATNRPDALDPALRRAGRFDREICLGIPNLQARIQILNVVCGKLRLAPGFSFDAIARNTPGFVGADLMALTREAAMAAVNRVFGDLKKSAEKSSVEALVSVSPGDGTKLPSEKLAEGVKSRKGDEEEKSEDRLDSDRLTKKSTDSTLHNATKEETSNEETKDNITTTEESGDGELEDRAPKEEESQTTMPTSTTNDKTVEESKMDVCDDMSVPVVDETAQVMEVQPPTPSESDARGPVLEELISWLHDQSPLTTNQLEGLYVEQKDFEQALKCVQPSSKREGFATVPDVTWNDVGSLQDIREELKMAILAPVRHPAQCDSLGLATPTGVLLCGPPGCGKTLLAKAIANEAGINFISVKGPELLNMYLGESERAVRQCFQRARSSAPCVIFFDELDALCPKRSETGEGASMRVVNQMLTEMDGIEGRKDVYLMAATNRPDIVDPAVLRPGRLDKILYVGLPSAKDRVDILYAVTKKGTKPSLAEDVSLESLGECSQCEGYSGADLSALVREASMEALREALLLDDSSDQLVVANKHFSRALEKIRPSVMDKDKKYYEKLRETYTTVPQSSNCRFAVECGAAIVL